MRRKKHQLEAVPLFAACDRYELDLIWNSARSVTFSAGEVLAVEGERGDEFVVISDGMAEVSIAGKHITTLGPGDFFGEVSLLDGGPRTATVTANTAIDAFSISRQEFLWAIQNAPTLAENLLVGVATRLRETNARLVH